MVTQVDKSRSFEQFPGFTRPESNYYRLPNNWFDIWQQARQQALAANQPFRIWMINILAQSRPYPLIKHPTIPAPTATKTVHVRDVPERVWRRAKENAIASGLTLRTFVIHLLANHQPLA